MRNIGSIMNTSIDDLSERISILRRAESVDEEGNPVQGNPETVRECWAKVLPSGALIRDGYSETVNQVNYRIVIRYYTGIKPDDYIMWRDKNLIMTAPPYDAESRHVWTVLECKELIEDAGRS